MRNEIKELIRRLFSLRNSHYAKFELFRNELNELDEHDKWILFNIIKTLELDLKENLKD